MSKNNCVNSDKRHNKKNASVLQLDVDIVPPAFNFVTLFVKWGSWTPVFMRILRLSWAC